MNWRVVWIITSITRVEHSDIACLGFNYSSHVALLLIWVWKACMSYAFIFFFLEMHLGEIQCAEHFILQHTSLPAPAIKWTLDVWDLSSCFLLFCLFCVATVAFSRFLHLITGSFADMLCLNIHLNPNFQDSVSCIVWCLVLLPHSKTVVSLNPIVRPLCVEFACSLAVCMLCQFPLDALGQDTDPRTRSSPQVPYHGCPLLFTDG